MKKKNKRKSYERVGKQKRRGACIKRYRSRKIGADSLSRSERIQESSPLDKGGSRAGKGGGEREGGGGERRGG